MAIFPEFPARFFNAFVILGLWLACDAGDSDSEDAALVRQFGLVPRISCEFNCSPVTPSISGFRRSSAQVNGGNVLRSQMLHSGRLNLVFYTSCISCDSACSCLTDVSLGEKCNPHFLVVGTQRDCPHGY